MKKFLHNIYLLFFQFFRGLRNADTIAFSTNNNSDDFGGKVEVRDEEKSVYKDLLRGEVTQEVKELRHEMYFTQRLSEKYDYSGGGFATKKNNIADYKGDADMSDGLEIILVQSNKKFDKMRHQLNGIKDDNGYINTSEEDDYTFEIERSFLPKFKTEQYISKVVIKKVPLTINEVVIDVYLSKYPIQYDRIHRQFVNELNKIYNGERKSEILDFDSISFISDGAWGADLGLNFKYSNIEPIGINEYDGNYILKFSANTVLDGVDLFEQYRDPIADRKNENNESRNGEPTIDFEIAMNKQ